MHNLKHDELPVHPTLLHPRTGAPLRAVGLRPNGDPLWPIMGGDGSEGDANDGGNNDNGGGDNDGGEGDNGRQDDRRSNDDRNRDDDNDDRDRDDENRDDDSDEDRRVRRANREAQRYRQQLRDTEQRLDEQGQVLDALRKALTGDDGDDNNGGDAEQLQTQVEQLREQNRSLQVEQAVRDIAADQNGDAAALLDSKRFLADIAELDPSEGKDFRDALTDHIKEAVNRDKKLRADQGSSRGGADLPGGSGEGSTRKPRGLAAAISNRYGG